MLLLMSVVGKALDHKDKGSVWCMGRCVTATEMETIALSLSLIFKCDQLYIPSKCWIN